MRIKPESVQLVLEIMRTEFRIRPESVQVRNSTSSGIVLKWFVFRHFAGTFYWLDLARTNSGNLPEISDKMPEKFLRVNIIVSTAFNA